VLGRVKDEEIDASLLDRLDHVRAVLAKNAM
jgi:hypothetical protein